MKLTNFSLDKDSIGIHYKGKYLDLYNNFDFQGFQHDTASRHLELTWTRSYEDWANENIPAFKLVFRDLSFFKIRERDTSLSASEGICLSLIGFLPNYMRDDFDSYVDTEHISESDNLNIVFQSDLALKINCKSADFVELNR